MIPTAPLRLRNPLAETILRALHDTAARHELERVASGAEPASAWLAEATAAEAALVRERARRAGEALRGGPTLPVEPSLDEALAAAATLFDAGLHFEVHELLEPYWTRSGGAERQALQGLIQIAVGYQHLANGNLAGARALLDEGPRRLGEGRLGGVDLGPFAVAVAADAARVAGEAPPTIPPFPRRDTRRETKWISS
jgi:DUF309 family protein family protein